MNSVLEAMGLGAEQQAALSEQVKKTPKKVAGRIAQIDADFIAYYVSAESKAQLDPSDETPRKTIDEVYQACREFADYIRTMAGAEYAVLHVTTDQTKGGRDTIAIQREYQGNRTGREKPEFLSAARKYLGQGLKDTVPGITGINHTSQEADDGLAQAVFHDQDNSVMCSLDKDLRMIPGWRLDMNTFELSNNPDNFGHIELDDSKSSKKIVGQGTKFFWAQVLQGDTADNIQGIPAVTGEFWQKVAPTQAYQKLYDEYIRAEPAKWTDAKEARLQKMLSATKQCGAVLAYNLIDPCKTDAECFNLVRKIYRAYPEKFSHWETGKEHTPTRVLLSEMQLLWMRRNDDPMDVLNWIKGGFK